MPTANLNNEGLQIDTGKDSIVIVDMIEAIPGGKTLNVTGVTELVLKAGHVIIRETATGDYKPQAVTAGVYDVLPAGHTYAGVLVASVLTAKPFASIMVRGSVNEVASPYAPLAAAKTALPLIRFTQD